MVWLRSLLLISLVGVLALLTRATSGATTAWIVFSTGLVLLVMLHVWHLSRALKWTNDLRKPPPSASATWGELLVRLHRHLRKQERDLADAREAVQTWLAASQALPDGVVILNENLLIDWCNREARRYLGLRLPADRGQNLLNLVRGPEFVRYAQQSDWPEPTVVPAPGNAERLLLVQFIPYGRRQRLLVARDVTQLERMETTRRDFVANVSHELRTPLTVLTGFLETLREAPPGALDETQKSRYFDMMSEQAQRMLSIVADLLTLSTLESSRTREYPGPAGMASIIESVRQQAQALSSGRHNLVWNITPGLEVLGEHSELSSAVSNLVTNAVRYTPEGGTITVTWEPVREGGATFAVADTGIGIDPQHLPRLTERFYRVDRSRSRASGGTGLGLAIAKHVALRHDAELEIASEPGHGSTFALQFPPDRIQYAGKRPASKHEDASGRA